MGRPIKLDGTPSTWDLVNLTQEARLANMPEALLSHVNRAGQTVWMNKQNNPEIMQDLTLSKQQGYPRHHITDAEAAKMKVVNTNPSLGTKLNMLRHDYINPKIKNIFGKTLSNIKGAGRLLPGIGTAALLYDTVDWKAVNDARTLPKRIAAAEKAAYEHAEELLQELFEEKKPTLDISNLAPFPRSPSRAAWWKGASDEVKESNLELLKHYSDEGYFKDSYIPTMTDVLREKQRISNIKPEQKLRYDGRTNEYYYGSRY